MTDRANVRSSNPSDNRRAAVLERALLERGLPPHGRLVLVEAFVRVLGRTSELEPL